MTYAFKCSKCGAHKDVEAAMQDGPPNEVTCDCGEKMDRIWGDNSNHIPEYMKATAEGNAHTEMVYRMKHAARPTGRQKAIW